MTKLGLDGAATVVPESIDWLTFIQMTNSARTLVPLMHRNSGAHAAKLEPLGEKLGATRFVEMEDV